MATVDVKRFVLDVLLGGLTGPKSGNTSPSHCCVLLYEVSRKEGWWSDSVVTADYSETCLSKPRVLYGSFTVGHPSRRWPEKNDYIRRLHRKDCYNEDGVNGKLQFSEDLRGRKFLITDKSPIYETIYWDLITQHNNVNILP